MLSPHERYMSDPVFHALVHILYQELLKGEYTPTEVREAALMAQILYEQKRPRLVPPEIAE